MEKILKSPIILLIGGIVVVYLGNALSASSGGGLLDAVGVGIGLAGDLAILYALYLGARWIYKKIRGG